jgi:hypothetical protein
MSAVLGLVAEALKVTGTVTSMAEGGVIVGAGATSLIVMEVV